MSEVFARLGHALRLGLFAVALGANLVLASMIGVVIVTRSPLGVVSFDLAGVPLMLYAGITAFGPVVVGTGIGHTCLYVMSRVSSKPSALGWHAAAATLGALAGLGMALVVIGSREGITVCVSAAVGCSLLQSHLWWRDIKARRASAA